MPSREPSDAAALIVAFHTPVWTEEVARLARRLRHFAPGVVVTVLADETNGIIPTENFAKLSHNSDFSALGLPAAPARDGMRVDADYPLYLLRRTYPHASHFAVVEHDAAVNTGIVPMLKQARDEAVDLIAQGIRALAPGGSGYDTAQKHFGAPLCASVPFLVVSARAIDIIYAERRRIAAAGPAAGWLPGTVLIPSAAARLEHAKLRELSDFVSLPHFGAGPVRHIDDPAMSLPGTICHPVAGGDAFIKRRVERAGFEEIFDPRGDFLIELSFCNPAKFAKILLENVKKDRDVIRLKMFMALAEAKNWPVTMRFDNLALFKPALMSSALPAGNAPDLAALAGGGNNGVINGSFGFHTEFEPEPWWQVDLQDNTAVSHVILFNRLDQAARCRRLRVSGSLDGRHWQVLAEKNDDVLFGGADGHPLVFQLRQNPVVRYVRLTNLEPSYFHLDEVQVLGKAVA